MDDTHNVDSHSPGLYRIQKRIHAKIKRYKKSQSRSPKEWQSRFTLFKCIFAFLCEHRYLSFPLIIYAIMIQKAAHADIVTDQIFPITLTSHNYGKTTFTLDTKQLDMVYAERGLILYSSELETSRQIMSVSKHVDFTSLGLANFNVKNSLNYLHSQYQLAYYDGFKLVNGMEYHISRNKMQYSDCGLYCSSKQSIIIDDQSEFSHYLQISTLTVYGSTQILMSRQMREL